MTKQEQQAYDMGAESRRQGLSVRDSDLRVARRFGVDDDLLDAATAGWHAEDERRNP